MGHKRIFTKVMSILLTMVMVLSMIPSLAITAKAEGSETQSSVNVYFELPEGTTAADWVVNAWSGVVVTGDSENAFRPTSWGEGATLPALLETEELAGWGYVTLTGEVSGLQFVNADGSKVYDCWNAMIANDGLAEAYFVPNTDGSTGTWYKEATKATEIKEPVIENIFVLVGDEKLAGANWAFKDEEGALLNELSNTEEDADTYSITFKNVPKGTYSYKILQDPANKGWNLPWGSGSGGGGNRSIKLAVKSDITFSINLNDEEKDVTDKGVTVIQTPLEEPGDESTDPVDGIFTMLTDKVQVQIGDDIIPMQLYKSGVFETKAALEAGDTEATLLINGAEAGKATVSLKEAKDVYFRIANGKFENSINWDVTSAALVGNFKGIEFVNTDDRTDVTLTEGLEEDKRYDIAAWKPENANAELDYIGGGIYARTFYFNELAEDVEIADTGYKVAANDGWSLSWGNGADNIALTIPAGATELTVFVDTIDGVVYDSVRTEDFTISAGGIGSDMKLTPFKDTVSLIGTVRGTGDDDWAPGKKGYEYTQVTDNLYVTQKTLAKGKYIYKVVINCKDWHNTDNVELNVPDDNTNVIFVYDAKEDAILDSINHKTAVGELLNMMTGAAKQEVAVNDDGTVKFVCSPEAATTVSVTYAVYDGTALGEIETADLTEQKDGSFQLDNVDFGEEEVKIAYFYTIDGERTLDSSTEEKVTVDEEEYSLYTKVKFTGKMVTLPGTVNANGWSPSKESEKFSYLGNGLYELVVENVAPGNYEYKVAIGGSWAENYGANGIKDGANIKLTVTKQQDVIFRYNDESHNVVNSVDYIFAEIGLSGTGIPEGTQLEDTLLKGIYSVVLPMEPGIYEDLKFVYNEKDYTIPEFELKETKNVTFYFDPVTELYYSDAVQAEFDKDKIKFNSKEAAYKNPFGAVATGADVTFTIETGTDIDKIDLIVKGKDKKKVQMEKKGEASEAGVQKWSATTSFDQLGEYSYFFALYSGTSLLIYSDDEARDYGEGNATDLLTAVPYDLIVYEKGFETPDWMKNAVIYQIFPDRFYNGDTSNDKAQTSSRGAVDYEFINDWSILPENPEQETEDRIDTYPSNAYKGDGNWSNEIYGGDVQGIIDRIDYLKALGVTVIYLNPVCSSISSHRYDTSDYKMLDPILGDMGDFDELTKVAEENGMKVVLDGVFNHVSDDSKYFDRYYKYLEAGATSVGAYPYWAYVYDAMAEDETLTQDAAETKAKQYFEKEYGIKDFSYTEWFDVFNTTLTDDNEEPVQDTIGLRKGKDVYGYDGWWGYDSMPIIKATNGSEYQTGTWKEEIIGTEETEAKDDGSVTKFWLEHGSDGWRLDVANEVSDETWQHFRKSVKALDKDNVIIGEIWTDAVEYLMGDMYDSVMNYMFRGAVIEFAKNGSSSGATQILERLRERYPEEAFYAMMNLVDSHDTTRILSYLDGIDDDRNQKEVEKAFPSYEKTSEEAKQLQYVVAFMQMTYAGAPTIYYGDEIGMVGADDPDDRRAMTWGEGSKDLLCWYAKMANIRSQYSALRTGTVVPFEVMKGDKNNENILAYAREDKEAALAVLANNSAEAVEATFSAADFVGMTDGEITDLVSGEKYTVAEGMVTVTVPAYRGVVLVASDKAKEITIDEEALKPGFDPAYKVPVKNDDSKDPEPKPDPKPQPKPEPKPNPTPNPTPDPTPNPTPSTPEQKVVKVSKITVSGMSKKIVAGKKITLTTEVLPADASNKAVTWTSSNTKYATVNSKGVVTTKKKGIGKNVVITATAADGSGVKAAYKIKIIKDKVKSVKLKASNKSVKAGKKVIVKATVKTTGKTANKALEWTSSNTKYATVSSKGVVTTKKEGKGKTVKITAKATDGTGKKATIKITIK